MGGEALWELVKLFLTALVASGLTHLLTHRRFVQERWWDRKADAYGNIIGALVKMEYWLGYWTDIWTDLESFLEVMGSTEEAMGDVHRMAEEFDNTMAYVRRCAIEGNYVISRKAADALSKFFEEDPEPPGDGASHGEVENWLCVSRDVVRSCLEVIRAEAQSDLRVKWYSW